MLVLLIVTLIYDDTFLIIGIVTSQRFFHDVHHSHSVPPSAKPDISQNSGQKDTCEVLRVVILFSLYRVIIAMYTFSAHRHFGPQRLT